MKRVFFLLLTLIIVVVAFAACNNNREEVRENMDIVRKIWYAGRIDFRLGIFLDGRWVQGNNYAEVRSLVDPNSEFFADFYTEVRFVHNSDEVDGALETVIFAFPTEDTVGTIVNAINWEVDSVGIDLYEFGLAYPITVEHLVGNYEGVDRLTRDDRFLLVLPTVIIADSPVSSRVDFELFRLNEWDNENTEKVLSILDQLNMTQDEAGPILRAAGSVDAFVAVADLMLTQGLSAEDALAQYARE